MRLPLQTSVRRSLLLFAAVVVVTIAVVILVLSNDSSGSAHDGLGPITLTGQEQHGRRMFADRCANCHTLRAANAVGDVGPSLDMLRPPAPATVAAIRRGPGQMPANLVTGGDAEAIARFVAAVTAH